MRLYKTSAALCTIQEIGTPVGLTHPTEAKKRDLDLQLYPLFFTDLISPSMHPDLSKHSPVFPLPFPSAVCLSLVGAVFARVGVVSCLHASWTR